MGRYTEKNYKEAKGLEFKWVNKEGKIRNGLLADVDFAVGLTLKDIDDDDPDSFVYCYNCSAGLGVALETDKPAILGVLNAINRCLIDTPGIVDEDKMYKYADINPCGWGSCPF